MKNKKMNSMNTRFAIALTLIIACVTVASAKKSSVDITGQESSGFNALDHVLQKPLGNPSFPKDEKGFGKHLYFGASVGGSYINNNLFGDVVPGYKVGVHFGGWITPVFGVRLTGSAGRHSVHEYNRNDAWYGSIKADYMMNLSSLLYGYNPNRKFELIGTAGLMYQRMRMYHHHGNNYGAAASLQMRFNFPNSFYLFVEPEITMTAGDRYDTEFSSYRTYTDVGINVGFGYRILTGKQRLAGTSKFIQSPEDNIFYGISGGLYGFTQGHMKMNSPIGTVFMGKNFSPTSGVQLNASMGAYRNKSTKDRSYLAIGSLDYVLNLNNALSGYRPDDLFQMMLHIGPSMAIGHLTPKPNFGYHVGLTGLFRFSHNWGVFVNPQIYCFSDRFTHALGETNHPLLSVNLGIRYTVGDFSRRFNTSSSESDFNKYWFANAAVGVDMHLRSKRQSMLDGYIGIGRRFTELSSWRVNVEGEHNKNFTRFAGDVDYLSSISTAMYGYDEDRFFDVETVLGAFAGGAKTRVGHSYKFTFGAKAGVQANFRINKNLGVFVEPNILAVYGPNSSNRQYWSPEARVQVGVKYKW